MITEILKEFDEMLEKMIESGQSFADGTWEQAQLKSFLKSSLERILDEVEKEISDLMTTSIPQYKSKLVAKDEVLAKLKSLRV